VPEYREFAPPPRLADAVECFWWSHCGDAEEIVQRVLPDGCADLLLTRDSSSATLQAVGPMTRFEDYRLRPRTSLLGVRFRPGMWPAVFGAPADLFTDRLLPVEDLWGARAAELSDRLASAPQPMQVLASLLPDAPRRTPVQRALAFLERRRGCVPLDELARDAGLSARQFRRVCLEQTGLSPKLLARVLRFRHALARAGDEAGDHAGLAAECGYTDQSHLIAEFRRFSGRTPRAL
jgi:AraC-like DNA-binding protein